MRQIRKLTAYPPIDRIFGRIKDTEAAVFLDSSLQGDLGRCSIVALYPYLQLVKGEQFTVNGQAVEETFETYLKTYLRDHKEENETALPLVSGAVGYFSYDYGRKKEGVVSRHEKTVDIPDCVLNFYDCFVIEDHRSRELYLVANGHTAEASVRMAELEELVRTTELSAAQNLSERNTLPEKQGYLPEGQGYLPEAQELLSEAREPQEGVAANFTRGDYMAAVQQMIDYIVAGDIYVVNMTQQLQIRSKVSPFEMFQRLRIQNPSPFGGYLNYGDFQIVCASPERFLQMRDGQVQTRPIKGTRKRGDTPEEDKKLKEELASSQKDQSELLMIVDLERNDLNRVCVPGSVKVTELFSVETYATVFHLIANVVGQLRPELTIMDLLEAAFPGGSITGAPKLRAMELIDEQEHSQRNLYTGSIGYLSLDGDCDFNIVIRTAVWKDGIYHVGVGGGITCESELDFEYEETWQKAKALLRALLEDEIL